MQVGGVSGPSSSHVTLSIHAISLANIDKVFGTKKKKPTVSQSIKVCVCAFEKRIGCLIKKRREKTKANLNYSAKVVLMHSDVYTGDLNASTASGSLNGGMNVNIVAR